MNLLLRRPGLYLIFHWTVTIALTGALLIPWSHTKGRIGSDTESVTLVTGQVVHLGAGGKPQASADVGVNSVSGGDYYATPEQVLDVAGSYWDPLLFDLTYLAANGFDDAASSMIPVIVEFADHARAAQAVDQGLIDQGIHLTHLFEYEPMASGYVDKNGPFVTAAPDTADGVVGIWLDAVATDSPELIAPALDSALPLVGAPLAHQKGFTGKGIKIAVVDTGIDATHPDLAGRVVAAANFSTDNDPHDYMGHGTHVASIAAGTGAASDGKYGGIAPQAELINAKGLNRAGSGNDSSIMRAMEWAADQGARIENLSLGSSATSGTDPLSQAVNDISAKKNVLFVIAAGNSGQSIGNGRLVSAPGAADAALTVGAIDKSRNLAAFSSRGPRLGDYALKPDIVAPGVQIMAARANGKAGNWYVAMSGTSMATPVTAGAAALVWQMHPNWTAFEVKNALMNAATPIGATCTTKCDGYVGAYDQGAGLVSLAGNLRQSAIIEPAGVSFGSLKASEKAEQSVIIRNVGNGTLHVMLGGSLHGPQGDLITGLTISHAEITLAPGGTAPIGIWITAPKAKGSYGGQLIVLNQSDRSLIAQATFAFVVR
jgi:hypothetical protein